MFVSIFMVLWPKPSSRADNVKVEQLSVESDKLREGDYVKFGRFLGQPILGQVIDTGTTKGIMLFSDKILCFKPFDASEKSNSEEDGNRKALRYSL